MAAPKTKSTSNIARIDERVIALSDKLETYQATNTEAHARQEKSFEKFANSLDNLSGKMGEYNAHLAEHIRRTDLAEHRQDTLEEHQRATAEMAAKSHAVIEKWQSRATFSTKILVSLCALVAAIEGIVKIIEFFSRHS